MMISEIVRDQDHGELDREDGGSEPGGPVAGASPPAADAWRQDLAEELIGRARSEGVQLTGPGGLLTGIHQDGAGDGAGDRAVRSPGL